MSYTIRPETHELREARKTAEKVLEACKYILEKDEMIEVSLGVAPSNNEIDFGASGYTVNSEQVQIFIRPEKDDWKDDLEKLAYQLYGETWYYEKKDSSGLLWTNILAESLGLMFLGTNTDGKSPEEPKKEFKSEWDDLKASLGEMIQNIDPEQVSWQIKWYLGNELMEEKDMGEFPKLKKSDVEKAGENIFE